MKNSHMPVSSHAPARAQDARRLRQQLRGGAEMRGGGGKSGMEMACTAQTVLIIAPCVVNANSAVGTVS